MVDVEPAEPLSDLTSTDTDRLAHYPGDGAVDWVGLSLYRFGPMLLETSALHEQGGGASDRAVKQAWWRQVLGALPTHPMIRAISWHPSWDDWPLGGATPTKAGPGTGVSTCSAAC